MIDKFVKKFSEFAEHEGLENLTDEAKVALFGVYLDALRPTPQPVAPSQPSGSTSQGNNRNKIRKPNRPATVKQKDLIEKFISKGKLDDDIDVDMLTVGEASALIDHGIKSKARSKPAPEPEPEPEGEYAGSYSHSSGGSTSSKAFWE